MPRTVPQLQATASNVKLQLEIAGKPQQLASERAIVAIGISGNVENLGLEARGVKLDRGHVVTDANCKTNVPFVCHWCVAGPPWPA